MNHRFGNKNNFRHGAVGTPAWEQSRNTRAVHFEPHEPAQIRWLMSDGYSQAEIARFFGVGRSVIGHIARGNTWKEQI